MDNSKLYVFGDPDIDRQRLETQSRLLARYVRRHAQEFAGNNVHRILDVGCGDGQLAFALQDVFVGAELRGIDNDPAAIERANERAKRESRQAEFIAGDAQAELPAGPFDLVFMSLLLLHVPKTANVLANSYHALRPGGVLWIIDASPLMGGFHDGSAGSTMFEFFGETLTRIGGHPNILAELPPLLEAQGFINQERRDTDNDHPLFTNNYAERMQSNAAGLGAIYNARPAIAKVLDVPISRLDRLFAEMTNEMMRDTSVETPRVMAVVTAQKPE